MAKESASMPVYVYMNDNKNYDGGIFDQVGAADLSTLRHFLLSDHRRPLVATGSGGSESAARLAALLYGARGGVATAVSPYSLNSFSDEALASAKILLISKGGHNNDIVFATRRALHVNPEGAAAVNLSDGERNKVRGLFRKAGSDQAFLIPVHGIREGFVSAGSSVAWFSILTRVFQPDVDLGKYKAVPEAPYSILRNDGTPLDAADLKAVHNYVVLHGGWGMPVAYNMEGKLVETGLAGATVCDYRNYCHGRFIYTSNHLDDSAVILLVSPREQDIVRRTRAFLPASAKLVVMETGYDAPEASLDLLMRMKVFFDDVCSATGADPVRPANPGHIDKRVPIWTPFMEELKRNGPLTVTP